MKRWWWIAAIVVAVVGVSVALATLRRPSPWSSDVPAARAAFEAAMEASSKVYALDALRHLEQALELDPDFLIAKAALVSEYGSTMQPERRERLRQEVASAPLDGLSDVERFRIRYMLLRGDAAARDQLLDEYLQSHPKDVYALHLKAQRAMATGRLEEAEALHRRTVELDPNWVLAHNQLGYITMERGAFEEAENHFLTYRFIAPDQANPHDSLGELYTLLGRYEEAASEYRDAITAKQDFCPAWEHLVMNQIMAGDLQAARAALEQMQALNGCTTDAAEQLRCAVEVNALEHERRWQDILGLAAGDCAPAVESGYILTAVHRAAVRAGEAGLAMEQERRLAADDRPGAKERSQEVLSHMEGVRLAAQGRLAEAANKLGEADATLHYRGNAEGIFKLVNRIALAEVLAAAGNEAGAAALLGEVAAVNPRLVRRFADGGGLLGLSAPS